jgi:hypothetical protein
MRIVLTPLLFVLASLASFGCNLRPGSAPGFSLAEESGAAPEAISAVREHYARALSRGFEEGRELREAFSPELGDIVSRRSAPEGAREAYAYYRQHVMDRDWGSVSAYRINAAGTDTYAVLTRSDGGDCWLEVFDADGLLMGAARYGSGVTLWLPRSTICERVFSGELEPELLAARQRP